MDQQGIKTEPTAPVPYGTSDVVAGMYQPGVVDASIGRPVENVDQPTLDPSLVPSNAEDADLIEKPWVAAVKRVIFMNRADPFAQSKAMMLLREDYMKKRYGETIKDAK